ncbi:hypothetical protein CMO88_00585 [Candidatus Woesearchaeota archaeon]|nr:hypothetical protein [Candidatus Woesearchaeota archaeon]|tara:strand:+ start:15072 stop:15527 length:456 start_codon:yes stop_codon:yes gene_type:complete
MVEDTKKCYEELRKKHKLPKFEELEEFNLDLESEFLLAEIRKGIAEKIQAYTNFLSEVLNPDTNLTNMYESRIFEGEEKKEVFEVFRRLMFWKRSSLEASVSNDNNTNAEFIKNFLSEWAGLKPRLAEAVSKVKKSWESESEQTEKLGYFG